MAKKHGVPTRPLGSTGVEVSMVGLGGYHAGKAKTQAETVKIIRAAIDRGITFMDNSWDYHDGASEERMGAALADGYRERAFVMTKVDGRTKASCAKQIEQSLSRLRTDRVDLMQFHEVIRFEDVDRIFNDDGALEAMLDAKKAGKVRFVGFTGHKDPAIHLYMLERAEAHGFAFDAVQMPLNVMDAHFRSFERRVLPVLTTKSIGVLGMKPLGAGKILESGAVTAEECLRYAMHLPTSVVITGIDELKYVEQAARVAEGFTPMSDDERSALLAKTEPHARDGRFESFKTTSEHDATAKNLQWLG
ncbi:MAG: aldo/keto reductase [Polyangiales bacterium]